MMLLAIDTATRVLSLALYDGVRVLAEYTQATRNQHTVELAAQIQTMLAGQGVASSDLSALAIAQGPGSYSGLRAGFGVAKGICLVHGLPLIPVRTPLIFAAGTPHGPYPLWVSLPAGRRRIILQRFVWHNDSWREDAPPDNTTWAEALAALDQPVSVVGEWDAATWQLLNETTAPVHPLKPAWGLRRAGHL
ncbi:MAG: tRNA (adenosine(37)-N6)-threonylcarbamoyltransferase complex dimerization subunit type 1 TsaB, partial [Anaerolineales bacterium]